MPSETTSLPRHRLNKSGSEREILRAIRALEREYEETESRDRKKELFIQLTMLREQLSEVQGRAYHELAYENQRLSRELAGLKKQQENRDPREGKESESGRDYFLRYRLYALLLKKYAEIINESEKKTVGQIKGMITSQDLTIQSVVNELKGEEYDFNRDFMEVAEKAHHFISTEIRFVKSDVDINFWLSPIELLSEKIGDDEDLAVLMCSILYSLGDRNAEVVIAEMDDLTTHAFVITEWNKQFMLADPCQSYALKDWMGEKEAIIGKYSFRGAKIRRFLYKFNHKSYEQFIT